MTLMAVSFQAHGQLHYLRAESGRHRVGDRVLYPTQQGHEVAQVVCAPEHVDLDASAYPECPTPALTPDSLPASQGTGDHLEQESTWDAD